MFRTACLAVSTIALLFVPAPVLRAQGNCEKCDLPPGCRGNGNLKKKLPLDCTPIAIEVQTDLDFGRVVILGTGAGTVILDLQSGQRYATGGLDDLGGMPVTGKVLVTGAPLSAISVTMPSSVTLTDPAGGSAEVRDFKTTLSPMPILDASGQLVFNFSGTLYSTGLRGGDLRGRFPIQALYL